MSDLAAMSGIDVCPGRWGGVGGVPSAPRQRMDRPQRTRRRIQHRDRSQVSLIGQSTARVGAPIPITAWADWRLDHLCPCSSLASAPGLIFAIRAPRAPSASGRCSGTSRWTSSSCAGSQSPLRVRAVARPRLPHWRGGGEGEGSGCSESRVFRYSHSAGSCGFESGWAVNREAGGVFGVGVASRSRCRSLGRG